MLAGNRADIAFALNVRNTGGGSTTGQIRRSRWQVRVIVIVAGDAEIEDARAALVDAEALIDGELVESATRREAAIGSLPAEVLARYERNMPSFGSSTVVRFSGADCSGCPYSMPAVEADRVKGLATGTLTDCSECGRLVVR